MENILSIWLKTKNPEMLCKVQAAMDVINAASFRNYPSLTNTKNAGTDIEIESFYLQNNKCLYIKVKVFTYACDGSTWIFGQIFVKEVFWNCFVIRTINVTKIMHGAFVQLLPVALQAVIHFYKTN